MLHDATWNATQVKHNNKKIGEKDNNYFNLAERYLYTEFSIVLNKNFEDTKDYVIEKVMEIEAQ